MSDLSDHHDTPEPVRKSHSLRSTMPAVPKRSRSSSPPTRRSNSQCSPDISETDSDETSSPNLSPRLPPVLPKRVRRPSLMSKIRFGSRPSGDSPSPTTTAVPPDTPPKRKKNRRSRDWGDVEISPRRSPRQHRKFHTLGGTALKHLKAKRQRMNKASPSSQQQQRTGARARPKSGRRTKLKISISIPSSRSFDDVVVLSTPELNIPSEKLLSEELPTGFDTIPLASEGYELHQLVCTNNVPKLDARLLAGADSNMLDKLERSALHYSVISGHFRCVERLLWRCRELRVDAADVFGFTPLRIAIVLGRVRCARLLLACGRAATSVQTGIAGITSVGENENDERNGSGIIKEPQEQPQHEDAKDEEEGEVGEFVDDDVAVVGEIAAAITTEAGEEESEAEKEGSFESESDLGLALKSDNSALVRCFRDHVAACEKVFTHIQDTSPKMTARRLRQFFVKYVPDLSYISKETQHQQQKSQEEEEQSHHHYLSPLGLCIRLPNRSDLLQLLLDSHAKISSPRMLRHNYSLPEYAPLLHKGLRRQNREYVLLELLSTEKVFVDDLALALGIFYSDDSKEKIGRIMDKVRKNSHCPAWAVDPALFFGVFEMIQKLRSRHSAILKKLQSYSNSTYGSVSWNDAILSTLAPEKVEEIRALTDWCNVEGFLKTLEEGIGPMDDYIEYTRRFSTMDTALRTEPALSPLVTHFSNLAEIIPLPKVRLMVSMIGTPRIRLVKYRDLCHRLADFSDAEEEELIHALAVRVERKVTDILNQMDIVVGDLLDEKKQDEIYQVWKSRYRVPAHMLDRMSSSAFGPRRYLSHCMDVHCWDLLAGSRVISDRDVFLFSESIWIGAPDTKTLRGFFFRDTRSTFVFAEDTFRLAVYRAVSSEKIADLEFVLPGSSPYWARTLTDFISSPSRNIAYAKRILVFSRITSDAMRASKFLLLPEAAGAPQILSEEVARLEAQIEILSKKKAELDARLSEHRQPPPDDDANPARLTSRIQMSLGRLAAGSGLGSRGLREHRRRLPSSPQSLCEPPPSPMVLVRGKQVTIVDATHV